MRLGTPSASSTLHKEGEGAQVEHLNCSSSGTCTGTCSTVVCQGGGAHYDNVLHVWIAFPAADCCRLP